MSAGLRIAFFGSSLVSAYWNGAATYYRGLVRALDERGHRVTFYEPDAFERQRHRDLDDPPWARVVLYAPDEAAASACLEEARAADVVVKASGVGVLDGFLEREVLALRAPRRTVVYWDVDAPATLARIAGDPADALREHVPRYDAVLTYGGGLPVVEAYRALGARECVPVYNALDPETHFPAPPDPRFAGLLGFLGNRLPDREARVREFFFTPAAKLGEERFPLGGSGWDDACGAPDNVVRVGHVYSRDHNAFHGSTRAVLNVSRESMARTGFSPATRVFEAAGAGACVISDSWEGLACFLEPEREVLAAGSGAEVAEQLAGLDAARARAIGAAARARVLAEHTYAQRAAQVEALWLGRDGGRPRSI